MPPRKSKRSSARSATKLLKSMDDDDDDDFNKPTQRSYDVLKYVKAPSCPPADVVKIPASEFNLDYIRETGFRKPLLFPVSEKEGLGITVPDSDFSIENVRDLIGKSRKLDVMDCSTQEPLQMTLADWTTYYTSKKKSKLLNVISLEFSHSPMSKFVKAPKTVRELDWIESSWPSELKRKQHSQNNVLKHMKYPKVQKYCLMSVAGCYTDFHIDFGGSSVWYHVLRGSKTFFLIPPTPENIKQFEDWMKNQHSEVFLGSKCSDCTVLHLHDGDTFLIPTGWIHAVYTPQDSLVFGGNFLHGFNLDGQLAVTKLESRLKVPDPYKFPLFQELMWYGANVLATRLQGYVDGEKKYKALTRFESEGLRTLLEQLRIWQLSPLYNKRVPIEIEDGYQLLDDLEVLLMRHTERVKMSDKEIDCTRERRLKTNSPVKRENQMKAESPKEKKAKRNQPANAMKKKQDSRQVPILYPGQTIVNPRNVQHMYLDLLMANAQARVPINYQQGPKTDAQTYGQPQLVKREQQMSHSTQIYTNNISNQTYPHSQITTSNHGDFGPATTTTPDTSNNTYSRLMPCAVCGFLSGPMSRCKCAFMNAIRSQNAPSLPRFNATEITRDTFNCKCGKIFSKRLQYLCHLDMCSGTFTGSQKSGNGNKISKHPKEASAQFTQKVQQPETQASFSRSGLFSATHLETPTKSIS
eukprot:m.84040 g.84040  ORF g.84040 m.84040 type:complete len:694 (-) comp12952_c0_seq2:1289-3370(-)